MNKVPKEIKIPKKIEILADNYERLSSSEKETVIKIFGPFIHGDTSFRDTYHLLIKNGIILSVLDDAGDFNTACEEEIKKYIRNRIPDLARWQPQK